MDWNRYDAALFDLDGVVTPTAEVHMHAWAAMFSAFLTGRGIVEPYTDADYFTYVDGKPRYDGVRSFLASRGITLPDGSPDDDPSAETVAGLGNRKNDVFAQVLETDGVVAYPGSVALIDALVARGTQLAVVSSSRNAPAVLAAAGLADRFPFVMHGGLAEERGLPGKPAPDTFLAAAAELGVAADRAAVLEDAVSGVQAGAAGSFGLVIGVDRGVGAEALTDAGADVVVTDLAELLP
ncbi:beta-phosphoglucomutase family hydrolase [Aeromicrobium marinum DSM 15272]|uniref:Beta-phosphoglucomutase n=1 Tax=Aeromicrobium marinum DSM 15272 TaxID=585531 RepID=E2S8Y0_9ACTN|nr:beta-phosphoglucomutase family hydrolase [Aeromicrobium marinum]EFQ84635.1 beta-phosphoglucomutase family hydrolase [Aeromicrobium marinum DSM 15272]